MPDLAPVAFLNEDKTAEVVETLFLIHAATHQTYIWSKKSDMSHINIRI